jgi:hypothetical protein
MATPHWQQAGTIKQENRDMNPNEALGLTSPKRTAGAASEVQIAQLVGQVYAGAPADEKSRLLTHLLRPLGMLSLVAVANGLFGNIWFRGGWPNLQVRVEDAQNVQASDVITLVHYVQQVSVGAIDGLADVLAASPVLTGSTAAALLMTVLLQRARSRRASDPAFGKFHAADEAPQ